MKQIVITVRKPSMKGAKNIVDRAREGAKKLLSKSPIQIVVRDPQADEEAFITRKDEDDNPPTQCHAYDGACPAGKSGHSAEDMLCYNEQCPAVIASK